MFDRRISLVTLGVENVARSTNFYAMLGWTKATASQDTITFIQLKGIVLALFSRSALAADAGVPDSGPGFSGITLAHNLDTEAEVDAAYDLALSYGASPVKRPHKVFWGGYSGYFADPDGHLWELAYNPFSPLDNDGHMILPD